MMTSGPFTIIAAEAIRTGDLIGLNNVGLYRMRTRPGLTIVAIAFVPIEEGDTVTIDDRGGAFVMEED